MTLQEFLKEISARKMRTKDSIGLASDYVAGWLECLECSKCSAVDGADIEKARKHAAQTPVILGEQPEDTEKFVDGSADLKRFKLPEGVEVPKNTLMIFRNVVTTSDEDRDGDILHTKGAKIDEPMPLLWQHMSSLPIGKMLGVAQHTDKKLKVFSALLDMNELTEDCAKLIEAGAMRISHGFIPLKFEPREEDSKRVPYRGFDIREFEIMEESIVSVPSNRAAIIEQYSRDGLKSAEMNAIGKELFDNRDDQLWPGWVSEKDADADGADAGDADAGAADDSDNDDSTDGKAAGDPKDSGDTRGGSCDCKSPNRVTITSTDEVKSFEFEGATYTLEKGGRAISKENLRILEDVKEDLEEIKSDDDLKRSHVALLTRSIDKLNDLISKATNNDDDDDDEDEDSKEFDVDQAIADAVKLILFEGTEEQCTKLLEALKTRAHLSLNLAYAEEAKAAGLA